MLNLHWLPYFLGLKPTEHNEIFFWEGMNSILAENSSCSFCFFSVETCPLVLKAVFPFGSVLPAAQAAALIETNLPLEWEEDCSTELCIYTPPSCTHAQSSWHVKEIRVGLLEGETKPKCQRQEQSTFRCSQTDTRRETTKGQMLMGKVACLI